jgi:glycosyltransferase involved in cell wall biosynthesis
VKRFPRYSETFIVNEILAHEAAGCDVEVFSLRPPTDTHFQDTLARLRAPVHYVPSEGIRSAEFWQAAASASQAGGSLDDLAAVARHDEGRDVHQGLVLGRALAEGRFDHVHAHFASLPATVTRLAARVARTPWTFTAHAKDIFHAEVREDDLARKCREAAAVITVSDYNVADLAGRFGLGRDRLVRVYNGLDLARVPVGDRCGRPIDVLAVGRFVEKKGFDVLIDAVGRLSAAGRRFRCSIVGDGELDGALRARVSALGLGDHVRFPGARPQGEVLAAMRAARVFAAPCLVGADGNRDGLPTTILEAMASGAAVVATPVTGIPEVVHDGRTGRLVASGDAGALAGALGELLDRTDERDAYADAARALIEREFDSTRTAAALREVFERAAVRRREGTAA